ncbi:MAG: hypothetical protein SGBAC_010549 [Bacillariaceae sp.]
MNILDPDQSCFCLHRTARKSTSDTFKQSRFTTEDQKGKEEVDTLLSEALNDLSFEERQMHQEAVHGVADKIVENVTFINTTLQELDNTLLLNKKGRTFEAAEMMSKEYVSARPFRLMFLRANRYDAKVAADQMLRFFDVKKKLFGMDKLVKDITIEDLDEDDVECLRCGYLQWVGRDRVGRQIMFELPGLREGKTVMSVLRSRYYMMMSGMESERDQLAGCVGIAWAIGEYNEKSSNRRANVELSAAVPIDISGIHYCLDEIAKFVVCKLIVQAMSSEFRSRFTLHYGSQQECSYQLSTYGISAAMLPFAVGTNRVILDYHNQWLQSRLAKEQSNHLCLSLTSNSVLNTEPRVADVLFDGNKKISHQGNERLRAHVKALVPVYTCETSKKKKLVVDGLLSDVEKAGGRFLQKRNGSDDVWEELRVEESRIKVAQMFRNLGRKPTTDIAILNGTLITDEPRSDDVVFGSRQRSRGSELLQQIISDRSKEYDALDRGMKLKVVTAVVQRVQGQGGRFLQETPGSDGWLEVSNVDACTRISKYFRNKRRSRVRVKEVMESIP